MGGFLVNEKADLNDGKMELFLTKPGFFNGLLHYLFNFNLKVISSDSFEVMESDSMPWCLDGEMGPKGNFKIVTHHSALKIFSK
jgi:diacylglycerol kinase family enzyme